MEKEYLECIKNFDKEKYKNFDSFYESDEFNKIKDKEIQRKIFYYYALKFSAEENKNIKELYNDLENILKKIKSKDYLKIFDEDLYIAIINNYLEKIEIFNAEKEFYNNEDNIITIKYIIKMFNNHYKEKECPIEIFEGLQDFYEIILIKRKHKVPKEHIKKIERHLKEYKSFLDYLSKQIFNKNKIKEDKEDKKQINEINNNINKNDVINKNKIGNINLINNNNYLINNQNIKNINEQKNQNIKENNNNKEDNNKNNFHNFDFKININNQNKPNHIDINDFDNNIKNINNLINLKNNNDKNNKELNNQKKIPSYFGDFDYNNKTDLTFVDNILEANKKSEIEPEKKDENKKEKFKIDEKRYINTIPEKKDMRNNNIINPFKKKKEEEKEKEEQKSINNNNKNKKKLKKKKIKEKMEEKFNEFLSIANDIDINI